VINLSKEEVEDILNHLGNAQHLKFSAEQAVILFYKINPEYVRKSAENYIALCEWLLTATLASEKSE